MKKSVKIIMIIMTIVTLLSIFSCKVFAAKGSIITTNQLEAQIDYGTNNTEIIKKAGQIMGIIRNIAVIAGVIVLMIIGVKFILGSAEEKAEYKKSLVPLVVGIVVVMAATSIVAFLFDIMK